MTIVSEDLVRRLAQLAHVAVPEDELSQVASELQRVVGWVEQIAAIDVTQATEAVHAGNLGTPLRADVVRPSLPREVILAAAPSAPAGLFEVPKVVEQVTDAPARGEPGSGAA